MKSFKEMHFIVYCSKYEQQRSRQLNQAVICFYANMVQTVCYNIKEIVHVSINVYYNKVKKNSTKPILYGIYIIFKIHLIYFFFLLNYNRVIISFFHIL